MVKVHMGEPFPRLFYLSKQVGEILIFKLAFSLHENTHTVHKKQRHKHMSGITHLECQSPAQPHLPPLGLPRLSRCLRHCLPPPQLHLH